MYKIIWSGQRQCVGVEKEECFDNLRSKLEIGCSRDIGKNWKILGILEKGLGKFIVVYRRGLLGVGFVFGNSKNMAMVFFECGYCFFCIQKIQ